MRHAVQEAGMQHHEYIDRKKENVIFTMQLCDLLQPNLLQKYPPGREVYIQNLKKIVPAISEIRVAKVSNFFLLFVYFAKSSITYKHVL